ncbi:proline-rich protein 29-like [Hoplias malabaricus]|uniref:proline-rich protein 29-like n=1 Tax=Hoplias malabaricus TaxID=27720 RepID=UPI0034626D4D
MSTSCLPQRTVATDQGNALPRYNLQTLRYKSCVQNLVIGSGTEPKTRLTVQQQQVGFVGKQVEKNNPCQKMAWTEPTQLHFQSEDSSNIQIVQQPNPQPVTLFQQLPAAMTLPVNSVRPGHIREDLVELMMMQNAQMHQVIMNNMTMNALSTFGYTHTLEHSAGPPLAAEPDSDVYHHYYHPYTPASSHPVWMPPLAEPQIPQIQTIPGFQPHTDSQHTVNTQYRDRSAVPPTPPPSAATTVGADIPLLQSIMKQREGNVTKMTQD